VVVVRTITGIVPNFDPLSPFFWESPNHEERRWKGPPGTASRVRPDRCAATRPHEPGCGRGTVAARRRRLGRTNRRALAARSPGQHPCPYERDYARFRAFIGSRSLRTVGLGDSSDFASTLTGSAATRRRTLSAIKALLTTGFKMGALRFNVGCRVALAEGRLTPRRAAPGRDRALPPAHRRGEKAAHRAIIEALCGTGARVDVQLKRRQLVADIDGTGGYVTLYGKHGGRTIRVGRRTCYALQFLAEGKGPDERIIAITDERIRQILTAAAEAAGLKKKLSLHWLRHARGSHAHQRGASAATIWDTLRSCLAEHDGPVPQFVADGPIELVLEILTVRE
jgi:integrase/recombinase XerD